ncbi:hypothetical protein QTN25_010194 [Entamoeba marina]
MLIASNYFEYVQDFINLICVCKKFKQTTKKLRYNPIPITSLKLFPKIQTQYLYSTNNTKLDGVEKYEVRYIVDYDEYLNLQKDNIKCHRITYTKYNIEKHGINIPNEVHILSDKCFDSNELKSIIIPNTVTSIGNGCFNECSNLVNVSLPTRLMKLNFNCFFHCISLQSISISSSIQSLGYNCLFGCSNIKTMKLPNSVTSLGKGCFCECSSLESIQLPSQLIMLEENTFKNCKSLTNLQLPTTLILIGDYCFSNCSMLESIKIPNSVKSMGFKCFSDCYQLTSLDIKLTDNQASFQVSYSDSLLFNKYGVSCTNIILTENDIADANNEMNQQNNISKFGIPNNVVELGKCSFYYQTHLKSITIPTTITKIGYSCFSGCKELTKLSIPTSVKIIEMNCFEGLNNLKELTLPLNQNNKYPFKVSYNEYLILKQYGIYSQKVIFTRFDYIQHDGIIPTDIPLICDISINEYSTTIQENIISLKSNHLSETITYVTIPTSVTHLCDKCFKNYRNLKSITIPTSVKYIGKHLIDGCDSLTQLNYEGDWNNIVVSYDAHLKFKSKGLIFNNIEYTNDDKWIYGNVIPTIVHSLDKEIYNRSNEMFHIPKHITTLDNKMFAVEWNEYSKIKSVIIPTSITTIPKHCFSNCYLLTSVYLPTTLTSIKKNSFSNCISLQSITIPTTVITIEDYAFSNCYSLTSILLPTSLQTICYKCFNNCYQLKTIHNIPDHCF